MHANRKLDRSRTPSGLDLCIARLAMFVLSETHSSTRFRDAQGWTVVYSSVRCAIEELHCAKRLDRSNHMPGSTLAACSQASSPLRICRKASNHQCCNCSVRSRSHIQNEAHITAELVARLLFIPRLRRRQFLQPALLETDPPKQLPAATGI